jgi:hypothetical protein
VYQVVVLLVSWIGDSSVLPPPVIRNLKRAFVEVELEVARTPTLTTLMVDPDVRAAGVSSMFTSSTLSKVAVEIVVVASSGATSSMSV